MWAFWLAVALVHVLHTAEGVGQYRTEECADRGESFSGAWLTHVSHVLGNPDIEKFENGEIFKSNRRVPCEDASWFFFYSVSRRGGVSKPRKQNFGAFPHFSVDLLDFSVYHLSTIERLVKKNNAGVLPLDDVSDILTTLERFYNKKNMQAVAELAGVDKHDLHQTQLRESTVVIIPFIIEGAGEGNSRVTHRKRYLDIMFWSLYPLLPRIVLVVKYQADKDWVARHGYPVWDTILLDDLGTGCALPLAAVVEARRCLKGLPCRSQHDWTKEGIELMYFSEGDQVLALRDIGASLAWARDLQHTSRVLLPHRLVLPPPSFMAKFRKEVRASDYLPMPADIHAHSCCMDTGDRCMSRLHYKHVSDPGVGVANMLGVNVVMGHGNFWSQNYRQCNMTSPRRKCPDNNVFARYDRNTSLEYFKE